MIATEIAAFHGVSLLANLGWGTAAQAATIAQEITNTDIYLDACQGLEWGLLPQGRSIPDTNLDLRRHVDTSGANPQLLSATIAMAGIAPEVPWNRVRESGAFLNAARRFAERKEVTGRAAESLRSDRVARLDPRIRIHPVLLADRMRELQEAGFPEELAEDVAEVEFRMGFRLELDAQKIRDRAAEVMQKIERVEIPLPPEFHTLTPEQKRAMILIGKAMRHLEEPNRRLNSPYSAVFDRLMALELYAPMRLAYQRYAGVWNENDNKKRGILPGMEEISLPPTAGYYPPNVDLAEFRRYFPEGSPEDLNQHAVFVYNADGKLEPFPYRLYFRREFAQAAERIYEAAELLQTSNPEFTSYLHTVANALLTDNYYGNDIMWRYMDDPEFDAAITANERYLDRVRDWLTELHACLHLKGKGVLPAALEEKMRGLDKLFPDFEAALPVDEKYKLPSDKRIPRRVDFVSVLAARGAIHEPMTAVAYNEPTDPRLKELHGVRITMMHNLMAVREGTSSEANQAFYKMALVGEQRELVDFDAMVFFVYGHEQAHGNQRDHVAGQPDLPAKKALREFGSTLEEQRADIVGLGNIFYAYKQGVIDEEMMRKVYVTYVVKTMKGLLKGMGAHARGGLCALNKLIELEAISVDPETGMTRINHLDDLDTLAAKFAEIATILIETKGEGNYARAKAHYETYATRPHPGHTALLKTYKEFGFPVDAWMHYREFEELLDGDDRK